MTDRSADILPLRQSMGGVADQLTGIVRTSIIAAAVLAAAVIVFLLFRRSRRRGAETELDVVDDTLALDAAPFPIALEQAAPTVPMQLDPLPDPVTDPAEAEAGRRRAEIEALAERDPQKTAEFLRSLMDDRAGV